MPAAKVTVAGWVQRNPQMEWYDFLSDIRDRYVSITQVVFNTSDNTEENALFDAANNLGVNMSCRSLHCDRTYKQNKKIYPPAR